MSSLAYPPTPAVPPTRCCTPQAAWCWVREVAWLALTGDDDARRALPDAVDHWVRATHQDAVTWC